MARKFMTPAQVSELIPGLSKARLAQLRYLGVGPKFFKPTPRLVLYEEADVFEWVEKTASISTSQLIV